MQRVRASSESELLQGRFQPQMGRELEPSRQTECILALDPANLGRTVAPDKAAGSLLCSIEHHSVAH